MNNNKSTGAGKGSTPRKVDGDKYRDNWEKIFKKKVSCSNCGVNNSEEWHTCPYKEDINDDSESLCDCCPDCQYECAMDI